jgi:hypothetical protein
MNRRRAILAAAAPALALGAASKARADVPAIRILTAEEVAIEGGSLRFNSELAGMITSVAANESYVYIALDRGGGHSGGAYSIVRWAGGTNPVELIQGTWPDQWFSWKLITNPSGRVIAHAEDAVVVLG